MNHELNDPIAALRDELTAVSPSPVFADRVRERIADELEPLRAELADLTASPEFAVRVREQIEQSGRSRASWSWLNWRLVVPAAGLAAVLAAFVLWPRQASEPANTVVRSEAGSLDPAALPVPVAPPAVNSSTPQVAPPVTVVAPRAVGSVAVRSDARPLDPARRRNPATPRDPMLEVITSQPEILGEWRTRMQSVAPTSFESEVRTEVPTRDVLVAPVEVEPVVVRWLVEPPAPSVVPFPVIRIASAAMAERSLR